MAITLFTQKTLNTLRHAIPDNLHRYRTRGFGDYLEILETPVTRDLTSSSVITNLGHELQLTDATSQRERAKLDPVNAKLVYETLHDLTPIQAREERIWSYLCHITCFEYVKNRWPIQSKMNEKQQEGFILNHYFIKRGAASYERDNGISRLWWSAHIANQVEGVNLDEALEILLYRQDVREALIGRPTTAADPKLFSAILRRLGTSYHTEERKLFSEERFRPFMKELNAIGGVQLLEALNAKELDDLIEDTLNKRLGFTDV